MIGVVLRWAAPFPRTGCALPREPHPNARAAARAPLGRPRRRAGVPHLKRRSRRLLLTTNTEESAIAPPAIIGVSSPNAASGMAATL